MDLKGQDFGEIFPTGLRKGLDSKWSALAMHTVRLLPPEVWASYRRWALKRIEGWQQHPTLEQVAALFLVDDWHPPSGSAVQAWKLVLEQAPIRDAIDMRYWIDAGVNGSAALMDDKGRAL